MKRSFIVTGALIACLSAIAQDDETSVNVLNQMETNKTVIVVRQGRLAVVYCSLVNHTFVSVKEFDSGRPIYYGFAMTTNKYTDMFLLRPEYGLRISATGEDGRLVELTGVGSMLGRHFDDLKEFDKKVIAPNQGKSQDPIRNPQMVTPPYTTAIIEYSISPPDQLFNFKTPGKYTVTIEMACFLSREYIPHIQNNSTNYDLIKFPPVKLTVIKEEKK